MCLRHHDLMRERIRYGKRAWYPYPKAKVVLISGYPPTILTKSRQSPEAEVGFHPSPRRLKTEGGFAVAKAYKLLNSSNLEAEVGIAPRSPSPRQNLADFA